MFEGEDYSTRILCFRFHCVNFVCLLADRLVYPSIQPSKLLEEIVLFIFADLRILKTQRQLGQLIHVLDLKRNVVCFVELVSIDSQIQLICCLMVDETSKLRTKRALLILFGEVLIG